MFERKKKPAHSAKERELPRWARPLEVPDCPAGWATGPPDFIGVGAQRSGTSWWYRGIEEHPGVATVAGQAKELHYFNRFWKEEPGDSFPAEYHSLFPRPEGTLAGEWTPRYMLDFWVPPLLREAAPEARLLVLLRDPVERFRSGIERAIRRSDAPIDLGRVVDAVARGEYAQQLRRLLEAFPREQLLVLQFERCRDEPLGQLMRTFEFLGLDPLRELPASMLEKGRSREKPPLPDRWRTELAARLRADVADLAALFPEDIDLGRWPNFS